MLARRVLRRRLQGVFSKDKALRRVLRRERFIEGSQKVLRRQKYVLSQSAIPFARTLHCGRTSQMSFEPGSGACQSLAQKIKVPFCTFSFFFLQLWGFEGDFKNPRPRYTPNSGWNAFRTRTSRSSDECFGQSRFWGRGCDEAIFSEKKGFSVKRGQAIQLNEGLGKDFYRKGNSLKRFGPFTEPPDSENWKVAVLIPFPENRLLMHMHSTPKAHHSSECCSQTLQSSLWKSCCFEWGVHMIEEVAEYRLECHEPQIFSVSQEEDKRATTNVQNGLVFFFSFSFIIFSSLWTKTVVKPLDSKRKSWRKNSEKLWKNCVKMCGKVPKIVKKCRDDFAL